MTTLDLIPHLQTVLDALPQSDSNRAWIQTIIDDINTGFFDKKKSIILGPQNALYHRLKTANLPALDLLATAVQSGTYGDLLP